MSLKLNKKFVGHWVLLTIVIVFLFQMMSDVIEAIYTMDLLNTTLDAKVLGVFFFFTTPILFAFRKNIPDVLLKVTGTLALFFRMLEPFFRTPMKIWIGGISLGCILLYLPAYMVKMKDNSKGAMGILFSLSIACSSILIILFKTSNGTIDISLVGFYQAIGWAMGLGGIVILFLLKDYYLSDTSVEEANIIVENTSIKPRNKILASITGIFGILTLLYFAYNSPAVFTRWFEANYFGVVITLCVVYGAFIALLLWIPRLFLKIKKLYIWIWNFVFVATLIVMIILNQTKFVKVYTIEVIKVYPTPVWLHIITYFNLLLSPILFLDIFLFVTNLYQNPMKKNRLFGGFLLNEFILVVLIFALIFSNVWGYVEPVSLYMRGLIWAPFALIGVLLLVMIGIPNISWKNIRSSVFGKTFKSISSAIFLIVILLSGMFAFIALPKPAPNDGSGVSSLRILTYNIQQGANSSGDKNFGSQLDLIRQIDPDIIGLQESDTAKINTGNTDVVGYFAEKLDYYVYYGPKSVMQTYGCAILSRYPLGEYYSFYTFGDEDEIGSVFCEVIIGSMTFNVFVNHPAGSGASKQAHTVGMLGLAASLDNVILMGDFNWREDSAHYALVNATYLDTWRTKWPTGIDDNGLSMQVTIDHIFISDTIFTIDDARYIPEPESQTDHPTYWAEISW